MSGDAPRPQKPRVEGPRRVVGGHRLRRPDDVGPWRWPGEGWLDAFRAADAEELAEGLAYARSGQVATLAIRPGVVEAAVQGRRPRPHAVVIEWSTLTDGAVAALVADLSADSAASASVLLGDLPSSVEDHLVRRGESFRPGASTIWQARCPCGRPQPCRHLVALAWVLAERTSEDPWLLMRLRGIEREDLQDRVRLARRAIEAIDEGSSGLTPGEPLSMSVEEFWRPSASLGQLEESPEPAHAPLALLRRLGPSPINGRFPLVGLLASAYEAVARTSSSPAETIKETPAGGESAPSAPPAPSAPHALGKAVAKRRRPESTRPPAVS